MVIGRFAPSPTGLLHAGSVVAALASWLDARALGGRWLVRIEDVDRPRCVPAADREILRQLSQLGLQPDEPPLWQSTRSAAYAAARDALLGRGLAYRCTCTRQRIAQALAAAGRPPARDAERVYPGTCRPPAGAAQGTGAAAIRLLSCDVEGQDLWIDWIDARLGPQRQNLTQAVGDFVIQRADGLWAYQLAVVVDDAAQGITHVVRGEDLADNTPRQIRLQQALGLPTPQYLHTPLVRAADGHKLSKQNGALPVATNDAAQALATLQAAGAVLGLVDDGLAPTATTPAAWLSSALARWPTIRASWMAEADQAEAGRTASTPRSTPTTAANAHPERPRGFSAARTPPD
ncbi:MAG: tRNA glutamyl-Q(34) synthetase GluQRS [Rubrivivax sp.]|nr:tRNA glutamyl-Q(34) synthetase GluQRS [Rubrivivax sp.]